MKKFGFITNKYIVSVLILLCLLLSDVILHKGMSRVIIPASFSDKISPVKLPRCDNPLQLKNKDWVKAVNNREIMQQLPAGTAGIECDVYFDSQRNYFRVFHDSSRVSDLNLDSLLQVYHSKKMDANLWLDFKNLSATNKDDAAAEISRLKDKYRLAGKLIIESAYPELLKGFCDSGYFTSYYVPFFNPYKATENEIIHFADSVKNILTKNPTSALSGYYFQYPILKKIFPGYPILTWIDESSASVVSYVFRRQLEKDTNILVILYPVKD